MPFPEEHSCRLEDPKKFDKFNRVNCDQKHDDKCIDVIYGIKEGKSKIQALRYPKDVWDADDAKAHCKDRGGSFEAAKESDSKKEEPENIERRCFSVKEFRVTEEDDLPKITGYPAIFNKYTEEMWGFREKIDPGAFKNAIKNSDTRGLFNHDFNYVLGRKSANTLKLKEDEKGLFMDMIPPNTQLIKDLVLAPMKRGDIKEGSFSFTVKTEKWEEDKEKKIVTRTIIEVEKLFDVSIVTFPAYPDTSVAVRSYEQWCKRNDGPTPVLSGKDGSQPTQGEIDPKFKKLDDLKTEMEKDPERRRIIRR